jgi:hypothetical protein
MSTAGRFTAYGEKHGLVITLGFSNGGWGYRQNAVDFSGEVCALCRTEAQKVFDYCQTVIRNFRGRSVDNVSPMRTDEPQPERRSAQVLRGVRSLFLLAAAKEDKR